MHVYPLSSGLYVFRDGLKPRMAPAIRKALPIGEGGILVFLDLHAVTIQKLQTECAPLNLREHSLEFVKIHVHTTPQHKKPGQPSKAAGLDSWRSEHTSFQICHCLFEEFYRNLHCVLILSDA